MKNYLYEIFCDWRVNTGNSKGQLILILFRIACKAKKSKYPWRLFGNFYGVFYRLVVEWILGIELPWKLRCGPGLRLYHGQGTVINDKTIIGKNCILRHNTTIGVSHTDSKYGGKAPIIGDNVDMGAGVIIIGDIKIGNDVKIAAGSVVVKSIEPGAIVGGNPAKIIKYRSQA